MGLLANFLSFEKPIGPILTRLLYYFALIGILWVSAEALLFWLINFGQAPRAALGNFIKIPIGAVLAIFVVRILAEFVLAQFRIDKSMHEQVTGQAADQAASQVTEPAKPPIEDA